MPWEVWTFSPWTSAQDPVPIANIPASSASTGRREHLGFKLSYEREFVFPQMLLPQNNFECGVASSGITMSSIGFHPFSNLFFVPSSAFLFLSLCVCVFQMSEHSAVLRIRFFCLAFSPEWLPPSLLPFHQWCSSQQLKGVYSYCWASQLRTPPRSFLALSSVIPPEHWKRWDVS